MVQSRNPAERPLPSPLRHALAALVLLGAIAMALTALALTGDSDAANPVVKVAMPERPLPPANDSLMANLDAGTLPDLLQGEVPDGVNPTEGLIGTPITVSDPPAPPPANAFPNALRRAPIAELHTQSSFGLIPMTAPDGRTAFRDYARPYRTTDKKTVSIIVGGLGIDPALTRRAIEELPPNVTLAFAAHAPTLQGDIDLARKFGHEVIIELPMEGASSDPNEPGADRMLRTGDKALALRNLDYLLSRGSGYFAVMPYQGDIFLARTDAGGPILSRLENAGLGFVADPQLNVPSLAPSAKAIGLPYRAGTMLIDETPEAELIARDLEALRAKALAGDAPIGFGFAYPATIDALVEWLPTLSRIELAPASAVISN